MEYFVFVHLLESVFLEWTKLSIWHDQQNRLNWVLMLNKHLLLLVCIIHRISISFQYQLQSMNFRNWPWLFQNQLRSFDWKDFEENLFDEEMQSVRVKRSNSYLQKWDFQWKKVKIFSFILIVCRTKDLRSSRSILERE